MEVTENLILTSLQLAIEAGKAIMDIYTTPFGVNYKSDNSPLTLADQAAHAIIFEGLLKTGLPVLSEEGPKPEYELRKNWTVYWLVDPLDGTKEFVKRNGDFTVNIALIDRQEPILGVVYAPVPGLLFWGSPAGSYRYDIGKHGVKSLTQSLLMKSAERLPQSERSGEYIVLASRTHMNPMTESYINSLRASHPGLIVTDRGSSLKFCMLAEGGADIYPRFGPTMEWDTAAGHAVAFYAGCTIEQAANGFPLQYNKPDLLNPDFIAQQKK